MSNRRKIDTRPTLHICPFCRSWTLEVPWMWEWPTEVQDAMKDHITNECFKGVEVEFS